MCGPLIGVSHDMQKINEQIRFAADMKLHVVIIGEKGVGKDIVARILYNQSPRVGEPFIKINCAALPTDLLESELFGYERGAFTGADQEFKGKFALADKGVLFLDAICEMPLALQPKLLHVLQSGEFTSLGSEKSRTTDAWVISSTTRQIFDEVDSNQFKKDLCYRENIINIQIPALRDRAEDIPLLIEHFSDQYAFIANGPFTIVKPSDRQMEALVSYPWPGNVRQIQDVVRRMLVAGDWDSIISELQDENIDKPNFRGEPDPFG
jgi:DNA-binding NtrC family response regulator